jgi:hypothetical protein
MNDICVHSFFYLTETSQVRPRPEFLKIPEVKALSKMDNADKVYAFINLYIHPEYYTQYNNIRRINIIKNEVRLDFDWEVTKPVQVVIDKFLDANVSIANASLHTLEKTLIDSIAMLDKVRGKINDRIVALENVDVTLIDSGTEINIADILTKNQADFKYVIDLAKSVVGLTATLNDLKKKMLGDKKEEAPRDIMSETFDQ